MARTEILTETGLSQKELYRRTGQCSGRDADRVPSDTLRGLHFPSFYSAMHGATLLFSLGANSPGSCWHDGCKKEEKRVEGPQLGHEHLSLSTNHCFFCLLFNIMLLWAQDALREYAVLHGCLWTPSHNVAGLHPPAAGFSLLKTSGPMCFALVGVEKISQASYSHCLLIQLMADG